MVGAFLFITSMAAVLNFGFIIKTQAPELVKTVLLKTSSSSYPDCYAADSWFFNGNYVYLIITICITLPITMARNLDFLKYPSLVGMVSMILTIVILGFFQFQISCQKVVKDEANKIELEMLGLDLQLQNVNSSRLFNRNESSQEVVTQKCSYEPDAKILADWTSFENKLKQGANNSLNDQDYCYLGDGSRKFSMNMFEHVIT